MVNLIHSYKISNFTLNFFSDSFLTEFIDKQRICYKLFTRIDEKRLAAILEFGKIDVIFTNYRKLESLSANNIDEMLIKLNGNGTRGRFVLEPTPSLLLFLDTALIRLLKTKFKNLSFTKISKSPKFSDFLYNELQQVLFHEAGHMIQIQKENASFVHATDDIKTMLGKQKVIMSLLQEQRNYTFEIIKKINLPYNVFMNHLPETLFSMSKLVYEFELFLFKRIFLEGPAAYFQFLPRINLEFELAQYKKIESVLLKETLEAKTRINERIKTNDLIVYLCIALDLLKEKFHYKQNYLKYNTEFYNKLCSLMSNLPSSFFKYEIFFSQIFSRSTNALSRHVFSIIILSGLASYSEIANLSLQLNDYFDIYKQGCNLLNLKPLIANEEGVLNINSIRDELGGFYIDIEEYKRIVENDLLANHFDLY